MNNEWGHNKSIYIYIQGEQETKGEKETKFFINRVLIFLNYVGQKLQK